MSKIFHYQLHRQKKSLLCCSLKMIFLKTAWRFVNPKPILKDTKMLYTAFESTVICVCPFCSKEWIPGLSYEGYSVSEIQIVLEKIAKNHRYLHKKITTGHIFFGLSVHMYMYTTRQMTLALTLVSLVSSSSSFSEASWVR